MAESRDDKSDAVQRLLRDPLNSNDLMAWRTLAFALQEQLQSARSAEQRSGPDIAALLYKIDGTADEAVAYQLLHGEIRDFIERCARSHVALSEDSIRRFCMRWTGTQDSPMERDLRSMLSATGSAEWAEDARPWEMRDGDVTFLWMDDGIEVVAMSHGKRWRTVLPLPVRRTERTAKP